MIKKIYIWVFYLLLLIPLGGFLLDVQLYDSCEKNKLVIFPPLSFDKACFQNIENYVENHIGFRNAGIYWNSLLKKKLFNSSKNCDKALIGKDGFLFYTSKDDSAFSSYTRTNLLEKESLESFYQQLYDRRAYLEKMYIESYNIVFPNKSTIYPELVPWQLAKNKKDSLSKIEQVVLFLKEKKQSSLLIDVRKEILEAKAKGNLVYHKNDTHWNSLGAFYAYQKLVYEMGEQPFLLTDFDLTEKRSTSRDLLKAIGICNEESMESMPYFDLKKKVSLESIPSMVDGTKIKRNNFVRNNKCVLVFGDSYLSAIIPFFSLHFTEVHYVRSYYQPKMVEELQPDIVLDARVERYF